MKKLTTISIILSFLLVLPITALAGVGNFTYVKGMVDVITPGEEAKSVNNGDEVSVGDIVRSRKRAKAEITFTDGTIVRLARSTRLEITEYMVKKDHTEAKLGLSRGKIQSIVPKVAGKIFGVNQPNKFEVKTPIATCGVRGTDFFAIHNVGTPEQVAATGDTPAGGIPGGTTLFPFKEGKGYGYNNNNPNKINFVQAGQTMVFDGPNSLGFTRQSEPGEAGGGDTTPGDTGDGDDGGDDGAGGGDDGDTGTGGDEGGDAPLGYTPPENFFPEDPAPPFGGPPIIPIPEPPVIPPEVPDDEEEEDETGLTPATEPEPITPLHYTAVPGTDPYGDLGPAISLHSFNNDYSAYGGHVGMVNGEFLNSEDGTEVSFTGTYTNNNSASTQPFLFSEDIFSINPTDENYTTFDGGAFEGFASGIWNNNSIDMRVVNLYMDPNGNVGFLIGDMTGIYGPTDFEAYGPQWKFISIPSTLIELQPDDLHFNTSTDSTLEAVFDGAFNTGRGGIYAETHAGWSKNIVDQDWGIFNLIFESYTTEGGYYNPDNATEWTSRIEGHDSIYVYDYDYGYGYHNLEIDAVATGTLDINTNEINGTVAGAWRSIEDATTGVLGGELLGTFDPNNIQAVALGVYIDTKTFMQMVNDGRQAELTELNIPCYDIGKATIAGNDGNLAVEMTTTFLSSRVDGPPIIWAAEEVFATYTDIPVAGETTVNMLQSGPGTNIENLGAQFSLETFNSGGTWSADINTGSGVVGGNNITFSGTAAGTDNGIDTMIGTASGTVDSVTPPLTEAVKSIVKSQ